MKKKTRWQVWAWCPGPFNAHLRDHGRHETFEKACYVAVQWGCNYRGAATMTVTEVLP